MFFKTDSEKLDDKISDLEREIELTYSIIGYGSREEWAKVVDLMKEIQKDFKTIRYPSKIDRDTAWQTFFALRQDAHSKKQKAFTYFSNSHKDILFNMLSGLDYWAFREGIRQMFFTELNEIKAEVTENGNKVSEAANHFSLVKHEMTGDDKFAVHTRILEVRQSHDQFWEQYKDRAQELHKAKEVGKKDYEERQERKAQAKSSLEESVENNRVKRAKAENALEKMESNKDYLENEIAGAKTISFRERMEERLDELNAKITDTENYINKLKGWIEDGEDRLRNWT